MQFDLEIGGRVRRIRVEPHEGRFRIEVDGRRFDVDGRVLDRDRLSLLVEDGAGAVKSVEAAIRPRPGNATLDVTVDGVTLSALPIRAFGRRAGEIAGVAGPQQVTAPMPGKVVRVLVAAGDVVEPRQGLVVIEAMKMENELRAGRAGRVKAVRVIQGQSVEAGTPLVLVE